MPKGGARVTHVRDEALAKRLENYAALGLPQDQAATVEGISRKVLTTYYLVEWNRGYIRANANIGKSLYEQAVGRPAEHQEVGGRVVQVRNELAPDKSVAIFLAKTRLGMQERPKMVRVTITDLDLSVLTTEEYQLFKALYLKALKRSHPEAIPDEGDV